MAASPTRTCVVCRRAGAREELLRIVNGENGLVVDVKHELPGRGAYVHRSAGCGGGRGVVDRLLDSLSKGTGGGAAKNRAEFQAELLGLVGGESKPQAAKDGMLKKRFLKIGGIGKKISS